MLSFEFFLNNMTSRTSTKFLKLGEIIVKKKKKKKRKKEEENKSPIEGNEKFEREK